MAWAATYELPLLAVVKDALAELGQRCPPIWAMLYSTERQLSSLQLRISLSNGA